MVNASHPDNECGYGVAGSNRSACSSLTLGRGKPPSLAGSAHFFRKSTAEMEEEDGFYQKLNKLNESSGFSLLFNFRDSSMDLHQFYKIVTERGGYLQVTKDGKWEDVAFSLNQRNRVPLAPNQFQKLYATFLYSFEQMYHYRSPVKRSRDMESKKKFLSGSTGKRKIDDDELYLCDREIPFKKIECDLGSRELVMETPVKVKEARKDPRAPLGSRNCYQMFLKIECERLKRIHGETPSALLRDMVVEVWRHLSNDDKQPYIEASKKDKERFTREMAEYEENKRNQRNQPQMTTQKLVHFSSPTLIDFTKTPPRKAVDGSHTIACHDAGNQIVVDFTEPCSVETDGDYHVALQANDGQGIAQVTNEPMVQMAAGLMKKNA
ncbi:high mobility group B protein 10-like [Cynara cardunculus var. scolymus]|uniref:high mobility group B protein 10-like n=1 Tax=Cynara cardunculus var. scolymus TaxID=59895 RepID=UPI000D623C54|nr:high mobility group B protein 10-like [Cynara cardunculus var. scolymus]